MNQSFHKEILYFFPKFKYEYCPTAVDQISKTWPYNYDDSDARNDWGWNPKYTNLKVMVKKMVDEVNKNPNAKLL